MIASAVHFTDDPRYAWIDRAVCVVAGEVLDGRQIVLELARILVGTARGLQFDGMSAEPITVR